MQSWTALLWCVLVVISLTEGQDEHPNDSLKTAIEAVSRRQRDLEGPRPNYYASGGLSPYRYADRDTEPVDELAFLAAPRDFTGDGQPENIGYGYQKTIASPPGIFPPQTTLVSEQPHSANSKELKKLLLEYLDDETKGGREDGATDEVDESYYHCRGKLESKHSPFRERTGEEHHAVGRLETMRKRGDELQSFVPTSFRERVHNKLVDDAEDRKLKILSGALVRKFEEEEEEEEERRDRERSTMKDENSEEEYLAILRSVWDKYRKNNPDMIDIEDISEGDVDEILNYLGDNTYLDNEDVKGIKEEARKRQYSRGYDFLTHNALMGGWGVGGHQFKKRWNQRLDGDENQKGSFLYSLKFVSPAANREAIESLKDDDGLDLLDERDEDILRPSSQLNIREPDPWYQELESGEAPEELSSNSNEDEYQRLALAQQSDHQAGLSKKRLVSLAQPNYNVRGIFPFTEVFPAPEKKYLYDTAIMKKRYPVTKRSSNFYTSPPLLHHKKFALMDNSEKRKKKNAVVTTDPKVARELDQIFSSPTASDQSQSKEHLKESAHSEKSSDKILVDTEHVATTHTPVVTNSSTVAELKQNTTDHHEQQHGPGSEERMIEQPVTMSRAEPPLDIKKKSINWSDYFGIDRRRKKTGPNGDRNDSKATSSDHPLDNEWLLNRYYKTFATFTNPSKKLPTTHSHEHIQSKKAILEQPFDTRVFDTDIFTRTAQGETSKKSNQLENSEQSEETRIDNMDAKLRNIEEVIVNEAVKYTGAHEGTSDTKEIQEVKDKVLAHLATAYSLEKMRQALREFKSSLLAQKMSRYNPENKHFSGQDEKKKRVAVKKEKAEKDDDKKKRDDGQTEESDEDVGKFLDGPVVMQPLSEGDMGRHFVDNVNEECPVLDAILNTCQTTENLVGDRGQLFLPLCSLHQICYLCGPELGAPSPAACDLMFITEADLICLGDAGCQQAAQRSIALLRRTQDREEDWQCWRSPCIAHHFLHTPLPVPIPVASSR